MGLVAEERTDGSRCRGAASILAALVVALTIAIATPAQAAPNGAKAWGANSSGELGVGTTEGPEKCGPEAKACSTSPIAVGTLSGVSAVSAGRTHSLALLENGTIMAWGSNGDGQLGNGTTTPSNVPIAVSGLSEVKAISAGSNQSLALLKNGTVMAWGQYPGNGTNSSLVPVAVTGLSGVAAIAAGGGGFDYSLALLENGKVMAWGNGTSGQLGNGTTTTSEVPVEVTGLSGPVTAIAAGEEHGLALLSNGTVMAWGSGGSGQLGNGTETSSDVPVAVSGLKEVTAISGGGRHSLALLKTGSVVAWGFNAFGELGDGTSTGPERCGAFMERACSKKPVAVSKLSEVSAVAGGAFHSLALLKNGTVKAWGENEKGQLGDSTSAGPEACTGSSCSTTPVEVSKLSGVTGISAGGRHSLASAPPQPAPTPLPEVGRCVKVATGTGAYQGPNCIALEKAGGKFGKYNWIPVSATEKQTFGGTGGETVLATVGHSTIKCIAANISGEWRGSKTATVQIEFQACTNAKGQQCQSNPQNKSELKTLPLEAELGFIKNEVKEGKLILSVGLDLRPQPPGSDLLSYECGSVTESAHLEGSVIGQIKPIDKMTTESNLIYNTIRGAQQYEKFEGGPSDTLTTRFQSGLESTYAPSTLKIVGETGSNAAPLEIKAK
jgi:alpha-tubulin suppressor-like RCC1 family protein